LTRKQRTANSGLAKVAVQCSADPEVSGWLIKHWFSASTFVVKIATFAKPQNVCDLNQANRKVGKNAVKQMEGTKSSPILCGVRANRMADKLGESK